MPPHLNDEELGCLCLQIILFLSIWPTKHPRSPRGAMMIKTAATGCTLPRIRREANSLRSTPRYSGSERRRKTMITESRSENNQHCSAFSIPSSRREASTARRKIARNQIGAVPCPLVMRRENWICP